MGIYDHIYPTEAEKKLIAAAAAGEGCDFTDDGKIDFDAKNGATWGPERTIRAEVIIALATLAHRDWPVAAKGVRLMGARIDGALDFQDATLERSLWIIACHIGETVALRRAQARAVSLQGCFLKPWAGRAIEANDLRCYGNLFLRHSTMTGEVLLLGATIGGNLECQGATFAAAQGGDGKAFSADGMTVEGDVFLKKAKTEGEVRLLGAKIDGNLDCVGATFAAVEGGDGTVFNVDGMTVEGAVFLNNVTATGEVRFHSAEIGANLECQDAAFAAADGGKGRAFSADRVTVAGNVVLEKITAKGVVRLLGANIGGDLDCEGAAFAVAEDGDVQAFSAEGMTVEGSFFWRGLKSVSGIVDLMHAKAGQLVDDTTSWAEVSVLHIDGFEYGALAGDAPTDFRTRCAWLAKMPTEYFWPQPYEQLIKVLRQMGHEHDARKIAIAKQDAYRERSGLSWYHELWMKVFRATVRYGYEPWRALLWMGLVVFLGTVVYFNAFEMGAMAPSKERVYMSECYGNSSAPKCVGWRTEKLIASDKILRLPGDYPRFSPFWYSVDTFIPIVGLHQEDYWIPTLTGAPNSGLAKVYLWVHISLGWFLTTMFIVGFTNIVKKD